MNGELIKEEDFLRWPDEQQRLYTFRLLQQIALEVKRSARLRYGANTVSSFIGGIVGGVSVAIVHLKARIFQ